MKKIIHLKVMCLMRKYSTNDPFELCDFLNIKVMFENLGHINGFYQFAPKNKIIHINCNLDPNMQRIICAHELGHALFHSKLNRIFLEKETFIVTDKLELEADFFAADLLIDSNIASNEYYKSMTVNQIASSLNIPVKLLKLKFSNIFT